MIDTDLRAFLLAQQPIADAVGPRVYPSRLPQGVAYPAITFQRIAGTSEVDHDGPAGLGRARIQIDCWASDVNAGYAQATNLAESVRALLSGYRGPMGSNPATNARVINVLDVPEPETKLWRRMVEISLWHEEA